jgi:protein SCO1
MSIHGVAGAALLFWLAATGSVVASAAFEQPQGSDVPGAPGVEGDVRLDDRIGQPARLDVRLTDRFGNAVVLADMLPEDKPTLLVLAYYRCPMLCDLTLRGVARGLAELPWTPGDEYRVVTVSFDPRDQPQSADRARAAILDELGRPIEDDTWPFLVGAESEVRKLTDSLGFFYAWDRRTQQYAHPSGIFVLTPSGKVSRVLPGLEFEPLDLRMALVEAGEGKTGSFAEQVLLTCFRYDPTKRRYGPYVVGFLRLGAGAVLLTLALGYLFLLRRGRRRSSSTKEKREASAEELP